MVGLGGWLLARLNEHPITVGLALGASEIPAGVGYQRVVVASWDMSNGIAEATASFGPFLASVTFDTLVFYAGTEMIDRLSSGRRELPAGDNFDVPITVNNGG